MGKFIIIEGPDFCGKSTQLKMLMEGYGSPFLFTREPGSYLPESGMKCERLRQEVLEHEHSLIEEASIFAESRYIHTKEIVDLIKQGFNIISDRYIISSLAYQGYAQELGADTIYELNEATLRLLKDANITIECIKFTINQSEWEKRREERLDNQAADVIEEKDIHLDILKFFSDKNIFDSYTNKLDINVHEVDASGNPIMVYSRFLATIKNILNN